MPDPTTPDPLTAAAEREDCCVGETSMDGNPNGLHTHDCPAYQRQSDAIAKLMDARRDKKATINPAPIMPGDLDAAIRERLDDWETTEPVEVIRAVLDRIRGSVRIEGWEIREIIARELGVTERTDHG